MNLLPFETRLRIVAALCEGNSIRATERLVGAHRDTVMRLGVEVGEACRRLHDARVRGVYAGIVELDEIWTFVGQKQGHIPEGADDARIGDQYTFVALDATSKLVLAYRTGKRTYANTEAFTCDLATRVVGAPQINTDGFGPYRDALEAAFGSRTCHGVAIKVYEHEGTGVDQHRYAPGRVLGVDRIRARGNPDQELISTSYVERQNLTMRMQIRRFTRLCNGFSKKLENLRAAVALHFGFYNWCRPHMTTRVTPAMAAGLTDHVWSLRELVEMALTEPVDGPSEPAAPTMARGPVVLRVIQGGRA